MAHKILVVDDDRVNTALVKFGLAERQYEVVVAPDGDVGLELMQEHNPDLIILDVHMPIMNGYEFMTELKSMPDYSKKPVIMLTANETMEDVFKVEGIAKYFVKPININELINAVVECLGENVI
ncbi:MAG: DNA-binding response OmpR family regulator [Lysobacterales bacterium]|jgi:DNA-binding response OmpR family regulator